MLEFLKRNSTKKSLTEVPSILQPEDPVNYNSVLDYLVGLSKADYNKMIKSADIYREANAKVAKVVGIKDEPTHTLMPEKPSEEQVDADLDNLLESDDLETAFLDDIEPAASQISKPQAPSKTKQIDVKE